MSLLRRVRVRITSGAVALIVISALFSAAVYKIDNNNYHRLASVQATAAANGARIAASCHKDLQEINAAHKAIREQSTIQITTSRQAIDSINLLLDSGNTPPSLVPLYHQALTRQRALIAHEQTLRSSVKNLAFIC